MKCKRVMILMPALVFLAVSGQVSSADSMTSLRGTNPIEDPSITPDSKPLKNDRSQVDRNYEQQPPLIPHPTKAYKINLDNNKCFSCHSLENYQQKEATKISPSHYQDRNGTELAGISASRYFCNMCHVEQFDLPPMVENDFKSAGASQ